MKQWAVGLIGLASVLCIAPPPARAQYVLPYPSYMPGNKLYTISRLIDRVRQPFYFGNISAYKYHIGLSDKYLVEAKTLFEYKQYLLAVDALKRSDNEFARIPVYLRLAASEGKDVSKFVQEFANAGAMHMEIISFLAKVTPSTFTWTPEKADETVLELSNLFRESIMVRDNAARSVP